MMLRVSYTLNSGYKSLRLEVSDDVGGLLPQLGVDVTREGIGKGGSDEDIGKGDPLSDNVGSVKEDLVEDGETRLDKVDSGSVGGLGVWDSVDEEGVGGDVSEEDLLVGESHPLVDLCSLLLVGGEDGLVGAELGNCVVSSMFTGVTAPHNNDKMGLIRYCDTTRVSLDIKSLRQG